MCNCGKYFCISYICVDLVSTVLDSNLYKIIF